MSELIPIKTLDRQPFKDMVATIGNLPTSFVDSMSYFDMLAWLCKYIEDEIIPTINSYSGAIEEVQALYLQLKEYVDNYFDNLDVQEEINNKLDDMAESGQLTELITAYLELASCLCYDTVADLKQADNIVAGSFARTYGFHTLNDKGGAFYKIREVTSGDTVDEMFIIALADDSLVAELIQGEHIDVHQLGAYGDNEHDDTDAIQAAIDRSRTTAYLSSGNYLITRTLVISSANTTFESNGRARIYASDESFTGDAVIRVTAGFVKLRHLYIVSHDETEERVGVHFVSGNSYSSSMQECTITGTGYACVKVERSEIRILECIFRQNKFGIYCNAPDLYVENSTCEQCTQDGVHAVNGAYELHHVHAVECARYAFSLQNCNYCNLYGCCGDTTGGTSYEIRDSERFNMWGCWSLKSCQTTAGYDFHLVNCVDCNMNGCWSSTATENTQNSYYIQSGLVKLEGCYAGKTPLLNRSNARVFNCTGELQKWNQKNLNTHYPDSSTTINASDDATVTIPLTPELPSITTPGSRTFKLFYTARNTDNSDSHCGELLFVYGDGNTNLNHINSPSSNDTISINSFTISTVDNVQTLSISIHNSLAKNIQLGCYVEYLGTSRVQG